MTSSKSSKTNQVAADRKMIDGIHKHQNDLPPSITLRGATVTPTQCVTTLQSRVDSAGGVATQKAAYAKSVAGDRVLRAETSPLVGDFKAWLVLTYRNSPDILADYGVVLKQPAPKTVATKVVAVAKARATRQARHTMGPKEKAQIKGTLTGPVVVQPAPAVTPPAPQGPTNGSHA